MQAAKRPRTDAGAAAEQVAPVRVLVTGGSGLVGRAIQTVIEADKSAGGQAAREEWVFATRCELCLMPHLAQHKLVSMLVTSSDLSLPRIHAAATAICAMQLPRVRSLTRSAQPT